MAKINSFGIDFIESKQNVRPTLRFVENSIPHISQNSAPKSKPNIDAIPSLINETKIYVDSKLKEINLDILKKLEFSYSDLMERDHPHSYARIAFDCREILMDFTDTIFNDESLEDGHRPPKRNETKNKLRLTLKSVCKSETTSKLLSERFNYIMNYFDLLNDFIQKNTHPDNFKVSREDANSCLIYTYLFMRDILKILDNSEFPIKNTN